MQLALEGTVLDPLVVPYKNEYQLVLTFKY